MTVAAGAVETNAHSAKVDVAIAFLKLLSIFLSRFLSKKQRPPLWDGRSGGTLEREPHAGPEIASDQVIHNAAEGGPDDRRLLVHHVVDVDIELELLVVLLAVNVVGEAQIEIERPRPNVPVDASPACRQSVIGRRTHRTAALVEPGKCGAELDRCFIGRQQC